MVLLAQHHGLTFLHTIHFFYICHEFAYLHSYETLTYLSSIRYGTSALWQIAFSIMLMARSNLKDQKVHVKTHALAYGGDAVGTVTEGPLTGMTVFVKGAVPGESGTARVIRKKKRFIQADGFSADEASSCRVIPECPVYSQCGGCNLQHVDIEHQRTLKLDMVSSMLEKQLRLESMPEITLIGDNLPAFNYRRRITLHCCKKTNTLGFYEEKSHRVVSINTCSIALEPINRALSELNKYSNFLCNNFDSIVIEVTDTNEAIVVLELEVAKESTVLSYLVERVSDSLKLLILDKKESENYLYFKGKSISDTELSPLSHFSQVNPYANEILVEKALSLIGVTSVTELFAGSGNFTIPLAKAGCSVTAVELDSALVEEGKKKASGLPVEYVEARCEEFVKEKTEMANVLLLDPPRTGAFEVCKALQGKDVQTIIYVSCDLPTFIRDAQVLIEQGFKLKEVSVLDMFPQTHHVETVALLHK